MTEGWLHRLEGNRGYDSPKRVGWQASSLVISGSGNRWRNEKGAEGSKGGKCHGLSGWSACLLAYSHLSKG